MTRRRLMLWQQAREREYIYDPASGVYPEDTGEWSFTPGTYFSSTNNSRNLNNGLLYTETNHIYATQHYFPTGKTACNCEMEVHFCIESINSRGAACTICLSDGENLAIAAITQTMLRVGERCKSYVVGAQDSWADKFNTAIDITRPIVFKVSKEADKAFYYLNDELLYTQTQLFHKSILPATESGGFIGSQTEPYSCVRFGGESSCTISKIIYREL